uniref:Ig-like domain-containing protein n=1 Tax=Erpetoichthys calabaricus TaxID=27687 RepID=A0A8C4TEK6_ERPCA
MGIKVQGKRKRGRPQHPVTVPNAPVTALVGESVILPCHLSAEISAVEKEVRWYRVRNNKFSIVLSNVTKKSIPEIRNEEYSDRVNFFIQEMEKGNASLQMKNTAFSDEGEYKCCVISDNLHCKNVKLLVPGNMINYYLSLKHKLKNVIELFANTAVTGVIITECLISLINFLQ